jgi:phosphoribosyl 1,2-cyclic phosphodiesterase
MRIWLLSSGSSGNAAIVEAEGGRLLIDAGIGPRVATARMRALGGDLFPRGVDGIVITHQHGDHIAHLEPLARALRAPIFLHAGITAARARRRFDVRPYVAGEAFQVGPFEVRAESVPHDAPQVALRIAAGGLAFGLATDLGHVPLGLAALLGSCDAALIEANYCPVMMSEGPYPPHLKRRVTGAFGHLANDQTALLAASLVGSQVGRLWLGHLSRVNNTPDLALAAVRAMAPSLPVDAIPHGVPALLDVVAGAKARTRASQMPLPFTACQPPVATP